METHTEQLPRPKDFRSLFSSKIHQRAQAYYDAGMVQHVSQVAPSLWHAQVMGANAHYDVDIRIRHSRIVSAACTCHYGQKHTYCKHVGAALLALDARNRQSQQAGNGNDEFPQDTSSLAGAYWNGQFPERLLFKDRRGDPDERFTDED